MEELRNIYLYNKIIPPYLKTKPIHTLVKNTIRYNGYVSWIKWMDNSNYPNIESYCVFSLKKELKHINFYMLFSNGTYLMSTTDYSYQIVNKILLLFIELLKGETNIFTKDFYYYVQKEYFL